MEPTSSPKNQSTDLAEQTAEVINQVSGYGTLIVNSLYLIICGMVLIYLLHKLASKFLYPHIQNRRLIKVIFGTLYVLVLVITALLVLRRIGVDVQWMGHLALVSVLIGAVVAFFMVPFSQDCHLGLATLLKSMVYSGMWMLYRPSIRAFANLMAQ